MKLNTYLHFNGNCEEALAFYEKTLGFKPVMMMRYGETFWAFLRSARGGQR